VDHSPPHDGCEQREYEEEHQGRQRSSRSAGTNRLHDVDSKVYSADTPAAVGRSWHGQVSESVTRDGWDDAQACPYPLW